jgi:hypothetical protein
VYFEDETSAGADTRAGRSMAREKTVLLKWAQGVGGGL